MENESNKMLICRPKYQQLGAKAELKNYDVLMFNEKDSNITLILGQVKTGAYNYCTNNMEKDLNSKYNNTYFGNAVCYIADRRISDYLSATLLNVVKDLNDISLGSDNPEIRNNKICEYIKENNIKIEIPCLLLYEKEEVYSNLPDIKSKIEQEILIVKNYFDSKSFNISNFEYEIIFYIYNKKSIQ